MDEAFYKKCPEMPKASPFCFFLAAYTKKRGRSIDKSLRRNSEQKINGTNDWHYKLIVAGPGLEYILRQGIGAVAGPLSRCKRKYTFYRHA
jgi:hypothetical protein